MERLLTKEGFWLPLEQKCPKMMARFKKWIDQYKIDVEWDGLFNIDEGTKGVKYNDRKFHDLPDAMQFGIFIQFTFTDNCPFSLATNFNDFIGFSEIKGCIEGYFEDCEAAL